MDGDDGSGGAEMDEGEWRIICDSEGIWNPEGWRQRLEGRRQRKARRSRRLVDLVQPWAEERTGTVEGQSASGGKEARVDVLLCVNCSRPLTFARA